MKVEDGLFIGCEAYFFLPLLVIACEFKGGEESGGEEEEEW